LDLRAVFVMINRDGEGTHGMTIMKGFANMWSITSA
jgi:hypothetical protein